MVRTGRPGPYLCFCCANWSVSSQNATTLPTIKNSSCKILACFFIVFADIKCSGLTDPNPVDNLAAFNGPSNDGLRKCFEYLANALVKEWAEWSKSDIQVPQKYAQHFKSSKVPYPQLFSSAQLQIEKQLAKTKKGEFWLYACAFMRLLKLLNW